MRKITLLLVVMAVCWAGIIQAQTTVVTNYSINENFDAGNAGTWGFSATTAGLVFTNPASGGAGTGITNGFLNLLLQSPTGTATKTFSPTITKGDDGKIYVNFNWSLGNAARLTNLGILYIRDSSGKKIFGAGGYYSSNNAFHLMNINPALAFSDGGLKVGTFTNGDILNLNLIFDFSLATKTVTGTVSKVGPTAGATVTLGTYVFLDNSAVDIKDLYVDWTRSGSGNGTYQFDNFKISSKYNVGTPTNPTSNSPQCQSTGVTLSSPDSPLSGETWYWQTSAGGVDKTHPTPYVAYTSGTYYLRSCKTTDTGDAWGTASSGVDVVVYPASLGGTATSDAVGGNVAAGGTCHVSVSGNVGTTYQWYVSTDDGASFNPINDGSSATTASYTTPALSAGTYIYKVLVASGSCSSDYSSTTTVTSVISNAALTVGTLSGNGSYGLVSNGITSSPQTVNISGSGLTNDITVSVPSGFQVSKDDVTYSSSVSLSQSGGTVNSTTIYVRFAPSAIQAYTYTSSNGISIASSPATTQYLNLTGTGIAAEPSTQTSAANTSSVLQTSMTLNWTKGSGDKSIVLYSTNSDVATAHLPVDATTYTAGSAITTGYNILYIGTGNSIGLSGLTANTTYYFAVFTFDDNNSAGYENYNTVSPATLTQATAPNSNATDNFRTKVTSGRWDALSTWETSSDGNLWYPSTMLPQDNTTSVTVKANANPITIGGDILPPTISTENGAKLKISRVFTSANWSFAPTISGSGSITIQLDTVPNAKPYIYTINPTFSGLSTVNLVLNPLSDAVGIRIVGGGSNYNVGIGGSTQALSGLQFNVSTTKTAYQGFPLAADNYLQNAKLYVGDYVTVTRVNTQGSGTTNMYIGELSSNPTPSANPPKISGSATVSGRPLAFYIGSLNTDATYSGLFANSGGSDTYIHKVGTGNWTLTGNNSTYTGTFSVDAGTVTLASGAGLGTVPVTISTGATLVVNSGATMPTGTFSIGTNGISGGTLNIPNNSTISNLTITSTSAPAIGTTINLVTAADPTTITYTNLPVVPAGYSFNTTTGILTYNGSSLPSSTNISSAGLPSNASLTVLAGNTLTIDQNATVNTITVAPGAQVTLNSGKTLTANNVELQSSASGTATFVDADATGKTVTGTIQQYLPTGRNWYVGIPVSNGDNSITANNLTAGGATSVSYWNEPTGAWVNDYVGTLTKGMGYIAVSSGGSATNNISFTGTFNTGDLSVALTRTVGATKEGFNLIANPYPSYLNAMTAITNANSVTSTVEPTIWYRTKGSVYSFETVNTSSGVGTNGVTGYIPPMQAFWVRALSNTSLTFTNAMRYHANPSGVTTTVLKAPSNIQNSLVRLQVSNGTTSDETVIYSNANASNSFDNYDSRKMSNNSALVPEIYTTAGTEQLVINGLNEIPVNNEIPLGFNNLKTGLNSFTLRAAELRNLNTDTKVYLLDKSTNTETELTATSGYTFTSEATNTTSRFSVIFKSVGQTTGTADTSDKKAIVYTNNGHIVFVANEVPTGDNNSLMIFDATGRKVVDRNITSSVTETNNINTTGVYLVRAIVNGQNYSAKINLNH